MIKMNVVCKPILMFNNGVVTGEIHIDPSSILEVIMTKVALTYNGPEKMSTKKLINHVAVDRINAGRDQNIVLTSGKVNSYDMIEMTLREGVDLISSYLDEHSDSNKRTEKMFEDFNRMKEIIYNCDNCNTLADTANVCLAMKSK